MNISKNQIRPRRIRVNFNNSDILGLVTAATIPIVPPAPLHQALAISLVQIEANIIAPYGNIDALSFAGFFFRDDFSIAGEVCDNPGAPFPMTLLTRTIATVGLNLINATIGLNWVDFADIAAHGGIVLNIINAPGDFTGGDPANFLNLFIDYKIIDL